MFLYSSDWDIAVVAPLATDIDLSCPAYPNENLAYYDMTEDPDLLSLAKSIIVAETGYSHFNPQSLIIVTWYKVQRYNCPEDGKVQN